MKLLCALLLILPVYTTLAQSQPVTDAVLEEVCDCINADETEIIDFNGYMDLINKCAAMPIYLHANELADEMNIETGSLMMYEEVGERLGTQLALSCPKMITIIGNVMQNDADFGDNIMDNYNERMEMLSAFDSGEDDFDYSSFAETNYRQLEATGVVKSVSVEFPCAIMLETDEGETLQFYWLEYIGEDDEYRDNPGLLVGKTITLSYDEMEVYVPARKSYGTKRVIYLLESVNKN